MSLDERTPNGRTCSAEAEILFNVAAALNALSVEVARAARLADRHTGDKRRALLEQISDQFGPTTETLHDFRRLVREL